MLTTAHLTNDRVTRINAIRELIGFGKPVRGFKVDNHHRNGAEYHLITSTALILIFNFRTKKLITVLIARPAQIYRYYDNLTENAPEEIVNLAREHQRKNYNYL